MIEDVYEPLEKYDHEFREKFSELAREKFRELTEKSGIDIEANRRQVALIERLEKALSKTCVKLGLTIFALVLIVIGSCGGVVAQEIGKIPVAYKMHVIVGACIGGVLVIALAFVLRHLMKVIAGLKSELKDAQDEAARQMAPLNALYTWDIPVRLIEKTVPRLRFDPYFTARRLGDLERLFGWNHSYNEDKSVLFAQSGVINGNPFVFADCLEQHWETVTYTGTKTISWTEQERGPDGKMRSVRRHQTLTATVDAPKPVYSTRAFLLYGNDAAPNLTFSRQISSLSGEKKGFFKKLRTKWKIGRLKSFSQNLKDESQYTLMGNHEFEALFETMNRTNEVEYRLLFTPIAQVQMLKLLRDVTIGYGDDFAFEKSRKINFIFAEHLNETPLDTDPSRFHDWNYDRAAQNFADFNAKYFKSLYFAFAPLLAIPLYQQTRTHEEIWKTVVSPGEASSFWEHEAIANHYGHANFAHSQSVTTNILKTRVVSRQGETSDLAVTAKGFRTEQRVTHRSVFGGDGRSHDIAVHWIEYLPVEKTTSLHVSESSAPGDDFKARFAHATRNSYRRSIYSYFDFRTMTNEC